MLEVGVQQLWPFLKGLKLRTLVSMRSQTTEMKYKGSLTRVTSLSVLDSGAHLRGVRGALPTDRHNSEGSLAENSATRSPEAL